MSADPDTTTNPSDLIFEYLQRDPADLGNVASHFGLTHTVANQMLCALRNAGRIEVGCRTGNWRVRK